MLKQLYNHCCRFIITRRLVDKVCFALQAISIYRKRLQVTTDCLKPWWPKSFGQVIQLRKTANVLRVDDPKFVTPSCTVVLDWPYHGWSQLVDIVYSKLQLIQTAKKINKELNREWLLTYDASCFHNIWASKTTMRYNIIISRKGTDIAVIIIIVDNTHEVYQRGTVR